MAGSATVVSPVDQMLLPSMETIRVTVDALKNSAEEISTNGKSVLETCRMVSNTLSALGISGGQPQGFSLGALPIAMKALVATASKYVEQKTGVSLKQWADFVNTAGT